MGAVERRQVVARDGPDRLRRSALRHAVRVEPVDQSVEDETGDVRRIVVADLKSRQDLVALPLDLGWREGGPARHVGEQVEREVEAVLHDDDVDEPEIARDADGQPPADVVDGAGDLLGGAGGRALVEELPDERGDPRLAGRVGHRAGAQDHPHVDRRLLVMADVDHLEAVVERPDLVVRKDDVARQERRRRILARPVHPLRVRLRRDREDEADRRQRRQRRQRRRRAAPGSPPRARRAGALFAVEHVVARHLVLAGAHQHEFHLILDFLDVDGSARRESAAEGLTDLLGQRCHQLADARRRGCRTAFNGEKGLGQGNLDLVVRIRHDGTIALDDAQRTGRSGCIRRRKRGAEHYGRGWVVAKG